MKGINESFWGKKTSLLLIISSFLFVSCGKTDFYNKAVDTASIEGDPTNDDTVGGKWGDPGDDGSGGNGGSGGQIDPGFDDPSRQTIIDTFTANPGDGEKRPLDILWVVDDSGSMANEQQALADNFGAFINQFVTKQIDFNMAIVTTDATPAKDGEPVAGSMDALTYDNYLSNPSQFFNDFENMILVGTSGSGYEKGLHTSNSFFSKYGASFVRENSNLVVVYVSDEEDQSDEMVSFYASAIMGLKPSNSLVQLHAVVRTEQLEGGSTQGGARYIEATQTANGSYAEITDDFATTLSNISSDIIKKIESFVLSKIPDLNHLEVYVDGVKLESGWSYNAELNSIDFDLGSEPVEGSEIAVAYLEQE
ncbi:MAG: VWA domain-containing protein [Halobacteriovoraceae bacterium]|nr:VWA domain-containing protein [Halobacteriovoraceae bacterium]MCB9093811.1 VWA domain-containing protein [Halobacteriovoraceae bacterium]